MLLPKRYVQVKENPKDSVIAAVSKGNFCVYVSQSYGIFFLHFKSDDYQWWSRMELHRRWAHNTCWTHKSAVPNRKHLCVSEKREVTSSLGCLIWSSDLCYTIVTVENIPNFSLFILFFHSQLFCVCQRWHWHFIRFLCQNHFLLTKMFRPFSQIQSCRSEA